MPAIIRAEYLSYYNPSRNSDKLFNVFLIRESDGTYTCLTENGRRGSSLVCRTVCEKARRETAEGKFWEKVREKRDHRETPYREESSGSGYSRIALRYQSGSQSNPVVLTNETKDAQPKSNVIAFPIEKPEKENPKPHQNGILNSDQFDSLEL